MSVSKLTTLGHLFLLFIAISVTSCDKMIEKKTDQADRVDLTVDIDGKKTEMTSAGFRYFPEANGKREMEMPYLKAASVLTADALTITIPDFQPGKSTYTVQKGEVVVTYKTEAEISGSNIPEWISTTGTLEVTSFDGENIAGKLDVTLKTKSSSKTKALKNGVFKAQKLI